MSPPHRFRAFATRLAVSLSSATWLAGCGSAQPAREQLGFDRRPTSLEPSQPSDAPDSYLEEELPPNTAAEADTDPEACAVQRIPLRDTQRPIDVILVLDNSVSMARELTSVERSINQSFARILEQSGADYRVILISRHRQDARNQTDEARTAVCVSAPLSLTPECPAPRPGNGGRFFHYSIDVDSTNSLPLLLETYATPDPLYRATQVGWSEWLRPGSRKIFLEFTDDDSFTSAGEFMAALSALDRSAFGESPSHPTFVFHSVVGIVEREPAGTAYAPEEPLVLERCTKDESLAPSSGRTYQTISRLSGGLRYPLCAFDDYDAIFQDIARDGIRRSGLACSFPLPAAPPGKQLVTAGIELVLGDADATAAPLVRVPTREACEPRAFFIEGEQIELCPGLCEALAALPSTTVSLEFDCRSFVDVR